VAAWPRKAWASDDKFNVSSGSSFSGLLAVPSTVTKPGALYLTLHNVIDKKVGHLSANGRVLRTAPHLS
jgi:hypothetical protein